MMSREAKTLVIMRDLCPFSRKDHPQSSFAFVLYSILNVPGCLTDNCKRMRSFSLNETFFLGLFAEQERKRKESSSSSSSSSCIMTSLRTPVVFSRVFVAATYYFSVLFVSTLAAFCPRSVDINPGQGGKNVCFGHVRSSAAGVRKMWRG